MEFNYSSQVIGNGAFMFPDHPFPDTFIEPDDVQDHVVLTGTTSTVTIGIQGTVN